MRLHVILDLVDTPQGKKIKYQVGLVSNSGGETAHRSLNGRKICSSPYAHAAMQEDHSMWLESLLFHTLPAPVSNFLHTYSMPAVGEMLIGAHLEYTTYLLDVAVCHQELPESYVQPQYHLAHLCCGRSNHNHVQRWMAVTGKLVARLGNAFYQSEPTHIPKVAST
jgi:hypothetical protein